MNISESIFTRMRLPVENINEIIRRVERVFTDRRFIKEINKSKKNWMDISEEEALEKDIEFVKSL